MKLRFRDRLAGAFLSVIGLCAAAGLGYAAWLIYRGTIAVSLLGYMGSLICAAVLCALVFVCSLHTLRVSFRRKSRKDKHSVTVQTTQQGNGEVRVSIQALDALVKQAVAANNEGVVDIKTSIVNHDDSISVKIDMSLQGNAHIPNITMLLQSSIKSFIEEFSGIAVRDVSIMVKTIVPVIEPLAAIEQKSEPVVLEESEHREIPAPQFEQTEPEAEEIVCEEVVQEESTCEETAAEYAEEATETVREEVQAEVEEEETAEETVSEPECVEEDTQTQEEPEEMR